MRNSALIVTIVLSQQISLILSSEGDTSPFYRKCVANSIKKFCNKDNHALFEGSAAQDLDLWTRLLWNCRDDCRYKCMWRTVHGYQERGYIVPKFHGKWPFERIFGVQEPGSAVASLLNLAANVYMLREINRRFSVKSAPFVRFWQGFAAVCINAWAWSTVFHTRDTPFTEFMDYACALSMVMGLFIAAVVRVFHRRPALMTVLSAAALLYYAQHAQYLYRGVGGAIDYEYNMMVNIVFGVLGSVIWVSWAALQLRGGRARHAWRAGAFTLASGAALSLELLEFPPLAAVWDAHALWHLATAPLPLVFYRFVIDDLYYMYPYKHSEKIDFNKLT